jgi:hypothetical protein
MAITCALLTSASAVANVTSLTTASVSPTTGALVILDIYLFDNAGTPRNVAVASTGLTWVEDTHAGSGSDRLTRMRAMGTPSAGAATITFGGFQQNIYQYVMYELVGVDSSGTNGSGAFGQASVTGNATAANTSLTLAALQSGSATIGAFHSTGGGNSFTAGSGYTSLAQPNNSGYGLISEYKIAGSTTVNVTHSSQKVYSIASEIKIATVAGSADDTAMARGFRRGLRRGLV